MPHVVIESCIQCKYTDCVTVYLTGYFYVGPNFLVTDPDECIDCSICVPECLVGVTYPATEVSADQQDFIALNVQPSRRTDWPRLTKVQAPLQDHAHWAQMKGKCDALVIAPD